MVIKENFPAWLCIDIYSFMLMAVLMILGIKSTTNKRREIIIFYGMTFINIMLIIMDIITKVTDINKNTRWFVALIYGLIFIFDPIFHFLSLLYIRTRINGSNKAGIIFVRFLSVVMILHTLLIIVSGIFRMELFFRIGTDDLYHRGPYHNARSIFLLLLFLSIEIYLIIKRYTIPPKHRYALLFIPPIGILAGLTQSITTLPTEYAGMVIIIMILVLFVNGRDMSIDFLTGAYNRRGLDMILEDSIKNRDKNIALIMIDLDYFKSINDRYGHDIGDEALINTCKILKQTCSKEDIISRYGGDEFLVLTCLNQKDELQKKIDSICKGFEYFNRSGKTEYKLHISIGGCLHDEKMKNVPDFIKCADTLMYEQKRRHHEARQDKLLYD